MDTIKDFLRPEIIWFLTGLVLLILEFALPGLIIAFFGVGAWIVALVCLITDIGINTQLIIFIICSVLSLLCLRKWLKGIFLGHTGSKQNLKENLDEFVGQKAVVKEKIVPKAGGKVEFHGTNWLAQADEEIAEGVMVQIISKDNITLKVKSL
ncbi:MAG: NfeD family protein [Planctomycetes bacterium]|nr:NfeD family protein [Planctomycetota bacterium]MBL7144067.1 NfeD family protein [Phycisphaerae bacterium]